MEYPPQIAAALHDVMGKVGYVQKKGRNAFHNYNYAGEKDLLEVLRPAMVEAGLVLIPSCQERTEIDEYGNTNVIVDYTLVHKSGAVWPEKIRAFGTGNDKNSKGGVGDKGTYKAITGANKYLLFKLFQIETGDDPEKDETEPTQAEPPRTVQTSKGNGKAKEPPKTNGKPFAIPVPDTADAKTKWTTFAKMLNAKVQNSANDTEINGWFAENDAPLKNMEGEASATYKWLVDQMNAKITSFGAAA